MTRGRGSLGLGTAVSGAQSSQRAESLWPPPSEISLEEEVRKVQHSGSRIPGPVRPGVPGPETTHHGGVSVHQHGAGSAGREAWRRRSPRPTASSAGRGAGSLHGPRGVTLRWRGATQPRAQQASGPQQWAPLGGSMWAGRALIALGKVGQRAPSARPSSSERSLLHALQL